MVSTIVLFVFVLSLNCITMISIHLKKIIKLGYRLIVVMCIKCMIKIGRLRCSHDLHFNCVFWIYVAKLIVFKLFN